MPTFYAQKTSVQLSVADLKRASTPNTRTQQSIAASKSIRNIAQEFARGSKDGTLTETPLYTDDGSHVRFLGKHGDMPFFMVHAGKNFFDLTTREKRNRRPARMPLAGTCDGDFASMALDLGEGGGGIGTSQDALIEPNPNYKPPFIPHALCLTVFLSTSSFVRTKDKATMRTELNDVKIDVYYNGALCGSHYVPRRYSGEAYAMTEHIVRFTGRRIGRLIEKPWIIVPSGQNPNGGLREYRRGKVAYAGAQQRWNDISSSLLAEADKAGRDGQGERPIIGEYLESLAQLSMPREVEDMQKAGSPKIGIFDVVVIWGKGSKDGPDAPYIIEPTQIRNEGCTSINLERVMDHSPVQKVTTVTDNTNTAPQSRSEVPANARSIDDYSYASPPSVTTFPVPTPNSNTNLLATSPLKQHLFRALPYETPVKRSRGHYYDVLTTKKTLSEEINSIATGTVFDSKTGFDPTFSTTVRTTRASHASTAGSSPISSCPMTRNHIPLQTKIVKFKLPSSTNSATSPSVMNTLRVQDGEADNEFLTPPRERNPAPGSKRKERAATLPTAEDLDRGFLTPVLSTDCVTTYAPGGVVRNVGAARGGVFKEGGVVMGTRFVVGW